MVHAMQILKSGALFDFNGNTLPERCNGHVAYGNDCGKTWRSGGHKRLWPV